MTEGPNTTPPVEVPQEVAAGVSEGASAGEVPEQQQADIFLQTMYASVGKIVCELTSIFTGTKIYLGQGFVVIGTPKGDARVDFQFPIAGAATPQAAFALFEQAHARGKADALAQATKPKLVGASGAPLKIRR